jgi:hypothetical protein
MTNYLTMSNINRDLKDKVVSVDLSKRKSHIWEETNRNLFTSIDLDFVHIEWDGFTLDLYYRRT